MLEIDSKKYKTPLFICDDLSLMLLPSCFSHSLTKNQTIYVLERKVGKKGFVTQKLKENQIKRKQVELILEKLRNFLQWIEEYALSNSEVSIATHHNLSNKILNYYINDILIDKLKKSEGVVKKHVSALKAYYNYLANAGFTNIKNLMIEPRLQEQARDNKKPRTAVKYLTPDLRSIIYQNTSSIRDELLLKTGGEVGLRSKENVGILLNDFEVGNKKHKGLLSLFKEMKDNPTKDEFIFYLQGKYTKSRRNGFGLPRNIFFTRELLLRMKEYYDKERPESDSDHFFLNDDTVYFGTPISVKRASLVFTEVCKIVLEKQKNGMLPLDGQLLEKDHTHHVLRHSFGTDKFYYLAESHQIAIDNVTATSIVYITLARLMGHNAKGKYASETTKEYIRSCNIKKDFEEKQQWF
tara:strand:- start:43321 stop:44550 length:1230 start_codon:yes stop_codon:yes gene_type:complete